MALARSLWKGALVVGQVTIPAALHKSAEHVDDVSFKTLHKCGTPISHERKCATCGPIAAGSPDELIRAFEFAPGQFVRIEDDELEAAIGGKQLILDRAVSADLVRRVMIDTTYWIAPSSDDMLALRAYDALLKALEKSKLAALGRFGFYSKERVAAVWPVDVEGVGTILGLSTLYPVAGIRSDQAAEIRDRVAALGDAGPTKAEIALFAQVLEQRQPTAFRWRATARWWPSRMRQLVEAKQTGGGDTLIAPQVESAAPVDLEAALKKSVDKVRARAAKTATRPRTSARR